MPKQYHSAPNSVPSCAQFRTPHTNGRQNSGCARQTWGLSHGVGGRVVAIGAVPVHIRLLFPQPGVAHTLAQYRTSPRGVAPYASSVLDIAYQAVAAYASSVPHIAWADRSPEHFLCDLGVIPGSNIADVSTRHCIAEA
eukprot:2111521-Rhodomonas_salina.2